MTADEYKNMTVAYRNGAPVRLGELGTIKDGVEDERTASWFYTREPSSARSRSASSASPAPTRSPSPTR